jgi:hypothetical protein
MNAAFGALARQGRDSDKPGTDSPPEGAARIQFLNVAAR